MLYNINKENSKFILKHPDYNEIINFKNENIKFDLILVLNKDTRKINSIFSFNLIILSKKENGMPLQRLGCAYLHFQSNNLIQPSVNIGS